MNTKTWNFVDKSAWPNRGEWDSEPDKVQWIDEKTGLDCLAVRHRSAGHWCGYVGVPEGHALFGMEDSAIYDKAPHVEVHGGITFTSLCQEGEGKEHGVCHVAEPGRPEKVWWLGFDCAHIGDVSPAYESRGYGMGHESYKSLHYVQLECAKFAPQIADLIEKTYLTKEAQ